MEDKGYTQELDRLREAIGTAEAVVVGQVRGFPLIIKYPFWRYTNANPRATYACVNYGEAYAHQSIRGRSILLETDIDRMLNDLLVGEGSNVS